MKKTPGNGGFSLSEVLIAVAILAMGLVFIAGTFPVGIGLTTVAVERTTAAVVAEEAFAKIKLYGIDFSGWPKDLDGKCRTDMCVPLEDVSTIDQSGFAYPSFAYSSIADALSAQYYWSALCRVTDDDPHLVQVTVFVSRKTNPGLMYPDPDSPSGEWKWPRPVRLPTPSLPLVEPRSITERIFMVPLFGVTYTLITPSTIILDDETGQLYRIRDLEKEPDALIVVLDRSWQGWSPDPDQHYAWWIVPPPVGGGKYPCIGIFQRIIRF